MNIDKITQLYDITEKEAKHYQDILKILPINKYCCEYETSPFVDIKSGDFITPLEFLIKYYNSSNNIFVKETLDYFKNLNIKKIDTYSNADKYYNYKDYATINYVSNITNSYVIILWPCVSYYFNDIKKYIKKYGKITVSKKITLTNLQSKNIIHDFYNNIIMPLNTKERKNIFINTKLEEIGFTNSRNEIFVIVFENTEKLKISGSQSIFKNQLRSFCVELIKKNDPQSRIQLSDVLHINDYHYQTIEYCKTLFHEPSLDFMDLRNFDDLISTKFQKTFLRFNFMKNWVINNLNLIEHDRFCFIDDSVLSSYVLKEAKKLKFVFISNKSKNERESVITNSILEAFYSKDKISFSTGYISESKSWSDKCFVFLGDEDHTDFLTNPNNYFYWNGMKILKLSQHLLEKYNRKSNEDIKDIIYFYENHENIKKKYIKFSKDKIEYLKSLIKY